MGKINNDGMKETILGWFKRVHPEELWAVDKMPPCLTFEDMKKSMDAGDGLGEADEHSDTATRDKMLDRLAELVGKASSELVKEANAKYREKVRGEYRAKMSPRLAKPNPDEICELAGKAHVALQKVAGALSGVDCLALADGLGEDGIKELRGIFRTMKSQIEGANATLLKAATLA